MLMLMRANGIIATTRLKEILN